MPRRPRPMWSPTVLAGIGILVLAAASAACAASFPGATPSSSPGSASSIPTSVPTADPQALFGELVRLTTYAAQPVPALTVRSSRDAGGGVRVSDVSYPSPDGGRATAWLVEPASPGRHAGLVYLHGSETDRDDLLDEAVAVARGGAVTLVLDAPFARPEALRSQLLQQYANVDVERGVNAAAVMDVRRALDILAARRDVDPGRLGFVGHSWGANVGVAVAATDPRLRAVLLMVPRPSWTGFLRTADISLVRAARLRVGVATWERYLTGMAPFDALPLAPRLAGDRLYLQYGSTDDVIPEATARQLVDALPTAKVSYYPTGHDLNAEAVSDRLAWLVERLGLRPIPAAALAEVGLPDE